MQRETLSVTVMSCNSCEQTVENALTDVSGVRKVEADHEAETVEVVIDNDEDPDLTDAIHRAGYDVAA